METHWQNTGCNGFIEYCIIYSVKRNSDMFKDRLVRSAYVANYCLLSVDT
jgi:hypothetical protein